MSCGYFQLYPHWVLIMSCSFPNQNVGAWFGYGTKCEFFFQSLGSVLAPSLTVGLAT
jgi:hypothetical protein